MDNEKKFDKVRVNVKKYYVIKDIIGCDYCDLFPASNNASALRTFHFTLANQLKQGVITNVDDYELYFVGTACTYSDGSYSFYSNVGRVLDTEQNNKEEEDDSKEILDNV